MILECGGLERALRTPELMPDMRAHAERCPACAAELHLWESISSTAPALHEEWESPYLWSRIQANIAAEPAPRAPRLTTFKYPRARARLSDIGRFVLRSETRAPRSLEKCQNARKSSVTLHSWCRKPGARRAPTRTMAVRATGAG